MKLKSILIIIGLATVICLQLFSNPKNIKATPIENKFKLNKFYINEPAPEEMIDSFILNFKKLKKLVNEDTEPLPENLIVNYVNGLKQLCHFYSNTDSRRLIEVLQTQQYDKLNPKNLNYYNTLSEKAVASGQINFNWDLFNVFSLLSRLNHPKVDEFLLSTYLNPWWDGAFSWEFGIPRHRAKLRTRVKNKDNIATQEIASTNKLNPTNVKSWQGNHHIKILKTSSSLKSLKFILDNDQSTAWVSSKKGAGDTIDLKTETTTILDGIYIYNGNIGENWKEYARIKTLKIYANKIHIGTVQLIDSPEPQGINYFSNMNLFYHKGDSLTLEITDTYPGETFQSPSITDIYLFWEPQP
ncbi:hypothetical protein HOG98_05465 [bacterium]|jgi:hypothetical protein|nr:hypothetical protein [bacterium]